MTARLARAGRLAGCAWLLSFWGALAACRPPAPTAFVDRADIDITITPEAVAQVHEQFDVRVEDSPIVFERTVDHAHVDGLAFVAASLNGDELAPGGGDDLTVRDGRTLRVRWKLPAGQAGTRHHLELAYRATGVVYVEEGRGRLEWPALPAGRSFAVDAARVELVLPQRPIAPFGVVQAGWEVAVGTIGTGDGLIATGTGIGLAPAVVVAQFPVNAPSVGARPATPTINPPEWQQTEDLQHEFAPALVSGALFMLVIGGGIVWMLRVKHPRVRLGAAVANQADVDERRAVASGLRVSAFAVGLLALACMGLTALLLSKFGWWAQLIPASMGLVAVWFYASARTFRGRR